jgi:hypothetical protein
MKRWRFCSHLSPWNGVDYGSARGATVVKAKRMGCKRAARILRRSSLSQDGTLTLRRWQCTPADRYTYGGTTTVCKRKKDGYVRKMRIIVWR